MRATRPFGPADHDDLDDLVRLAVDCVEELQLPALNPERYRSALADLMRDPGSGEVWRLRTEDGCGGYLVLTRGYSPALGGPVGRIDTLYITPNMRRRGYGTAALNLARRRGCARAFSSLEISSSAASEKLLTRLRFEHRAGGLRASPLRV